MAESTMQVRAVGRSGWVGVPRALTEWTGLDPYEFRLAVWLSSHTEAYCGDLSERHIAERLGMGRTKVGDALNRLVELEVANVEYGGFRGGAQVTFYRDRWETLAATRPDHQIDEVAATRPDLAATRPLTGRHTATLEKQEGEQEESSTSPTPSADLRLVTEQVPAPPDRAWSGFWQEYPRKESKPKAQRAWQVHVVRAKVDPATVMAGLARWKDYWALRGEPEFVKQPATWLNQHCWDDPTPEYRPRPTAPPGRHDPAAALLAQAADVRPGGST